jgi:hypothetical protein
LAVAFCIAADRFAGIEIATPQTAGLAAIVLLTPPVVGLLFGMRRYRTLCERDRLRALTVKELATPADPATAARPPRSAR